jgi:hypothetical protein
MEKRFLKKGVEDFGMLVKEIRKKAKEMGINGTKMVKADLIRAIQIKEGNAPCFQSGIIDCPQKGCSWWDDCQK